MSPLVIGRWSSASPAKATGLAGNIAVPMVAALATIPVFRKDRRFLEPAKTLPFSFIESPFHLIEFRSGMSSLPSVRNRAVPGGQHLTRARGKPTTEWRPFLRIGLRAFGEAWNKNPGTLVRLTTPGRALFRGGNKWRVIFLSTAGDIDWYCDLPQGGAGARTWRRIQKLDGRVGDGIRQARR